MAETMTVAEARRAAHEVSLRTDPVYRRSYELWCTQRDARRAARRPPRMLVEGRIVGLPMARVYMTGPSRARKMRVWGPLLFSWVDDLRAQMCEEELRPGVTPMWSDTYERFGVRRLRRRDLESP